MAKTIALFNHKGGVSKTTTAFNLGWALANAEKKVLLVDLDSQCNLSGLILGYANLDAGLDNFYLSRDNLTLKTVVDALIDAVPAASLLEAEKGQLFQTSNPNLYLLPGHLNISSMDSQISIALKIAFGVPSTRNLPGALPAFINLLANNYDFDYVIYDLSPSVGGLNEVILMSSDYFIVPTSPDFFCWQAVESLSKHIPTWHKEIDIFKTNVPANSVTYLKNSPKFLGTIQQRYRIRKQEPAKSFEKWIREIKLAVDSKLVPCLEKINCLANKDKVQEALDKYDQDLKPYDLAYIADFNSLIAISQGLSKPIFELSDDDLINARQFGFALKTMKKSRDQFAEQFKNLASIIMELTQ